MYITLKQLQDAGACEEQQKLFKQAFGEQVEISEALAVQYAKVFNWEWAAEHLLSVLGRKAYREAEATAWKTYCEAEAAAWKTYCEAEAPAAKAYDEAVVAAYTAYREAVAAAWKTYREAKAIAFYRAYVEDHQ